MWGIGRIARTIVTLCLITVAGFVVFRAIELAIAESKTADSILVLGGSPTREIYAAKLAKLHPAMKILISSGSPDPCIWLIFDKIGAPKENVWMEHCSQNTFENFVYSTPILKQWGARKVLLVTNQPQAQRALPMAEAILGSKGIAVALELSPRPGGEEPRFPVYLSKLAAIGWAVVGQVVEAKCTHLTHLPDVDMKSWYAKGFTCQQQAEVTDYKPDLP